jgi:hypothetical protein
MPARRFPTKPRRILTRAAKPNRSSLSIALEVVEEQRDNLSRAESLLRCLTIAMEHGDTSHDGPYYPDVAEIARQMLRQSIRALDPINLPDPSRDKVKEELFLGHLLTSTVTLDVPLVPRQSYLMSARGRLRVHRRDYSRASMSRASSRASASINISV